MRISFQILLVLGPASASLHAQNPSTSFDHPYRVVDSIPAPESVAIGPDGAWYVSSFGKFGVKGDGAVYRVDPEKGAREIFAPGLDDPCGLLFVGAMALSSSWPQASVPPFSPAATRSGRSRAPTVFSPAAVIPCTS
jgi:hypothetical protein